MSFWQRTSVGALLHSLNYSNPETQNVARQGAALPPNASQEPAGSVPTSIESSALTQHSGIIEAAITTTISTIGSTSSTLTSALSPSVSSASKTSSFLPTSPPAPVFTTTGPRVTDAPSTTFEPSPSNPVSTSQADVDSGANTAGFDVNAGADASFDLFKADINPI